jgi:hypothetical protein
MVAGKTQRSIDGQFFDAKSYLNLYDEVLELADDPSPLQGFETKVVGPFPPFKASSAIKASSSWIIHDIFNCFV